MTDWFQREVEFASIIATQADHLVRTGDCIDCYLLVWISLLYLHCFLFC